MNYFKTFKNSFLRHPVFSLFILHTLFVIILIFFMTMFTNFKSEFYLEDDGYYDIGKRFYYGISSIFHQYRPPGIPLILSLLNFFPMKLQPYFRIVITQAITLCSILLAFKIYSDILPKKLITYGLIISLFNPLYIWWASIRSSPETYLTVFLGLVILACLKLKNGGKLIQWTNFCLIIIISLLFKPVLFLIPFFFFIFYLIHKKYKLSLKSLLIFLICLFCLKIILELSKRPNSLEYGVSSMMVDAFLTETIFETGRMGYYLDEKDFKGEKSFEENINVKITQWTEKYESTHHSYKTFQIIYDFFKDKAVFVILSKVLSPIYFISVADSSGKTIFNFILNTSIIIFSITGLYRSRKKLKEEIDMIVIVFIGSYFVYFLVQSSARYCIPILFYISVFASASINNYIRKYRHQPELSAQIINPTS